MQPFDISLQHISNHSPYVEMIADDPVFAPSVHLALEKPEYTLSLADLGYGDEIKGTTPTQVAATACFRVLSDEGVKAMYHVCKQLEAFTTSNARIDRNTRGGIYRSKFLRDFSRCPELSAHLSEIMQTELLPLTIGHNMAHLNYQPLTVGKNVDKWHIDTLQVDTVMFVTDPNEVKGGEFQYFKGTRDEMARLKASGEVIPTDKIIAPAMPGAGYAVLQQGNYVVHQASALQEEGERITLVNGFSYADMDTPDYTAVDQLVHADPEGIVAAEYSHHVALRAARRLQNLSNQPDFSLSLEQQAAKLREVQAELEQAIHQLENARGSELHHFGD